MNRLTVTVIKMAGRVDIKKHQLGYNQQICFSCRGLRLPERFCSVHLHPDGCSSLSRKDKEKQLRFMNEANYP